MRKKLTNATIAAANKTATETSELKRLASQSIVAKIGRLTDSIASVCAQIVSRDECKDRSLLEASFNKSSATLLDLAQSAEGNQTVSVALERSLPTFCKTIESLWRATQSLELELRV